MKIGIYGGSFNPIHKGHIVIANETIKKMNLDKLIFVPLYKSAFKIKNNYIDSSHRVNMIELVKPLNTEISLFEINKKGISYKYEIIEYFKNKFPNSELFFIMGSDNISKLNKWKNIDDIVKKAKIVFFKRTKDFSNENIKKYNCLLLNNDLYNFYSSYFELGITNMIDEKVKKYISRNFLYISDIMINMLDAKRHKHSLAVGYLAAELAKKNNYDAKKAWVAGVFHDITKSWSKDKHYLFLKKNSIDYSQIEDFELHSLTSYLWVKNEYMLDDTEILNSILKHTSLSTELSILDKIIFSADKLAKGRKFNNIQKIRNIILNDFDDGFKKIVKEVYTQLLQKRNLTEEQKNIFGKWMEK